MQTTDNLLILHRTDTILVAQTTAGVFDKFGAADHYGQFNLGLHVGDDAHQVLQHRAQLLAQLKTLGDINSIHWLNQTHSDLIASIDDKPASIAPTADALMTAQTGRALAIMTADCIPVAIFGDNKDAPIACIHAGWQGLVNGIIAKTVANMRTRANITYHAVIGAHISQASYEISRELATRIIDLVCDAHLVALNKVALHDVIIKDSQDNDKCLIDLTKLVHLELAHLDIDVLNDEIACTYQDTRFYSYRAQTHANKAATGRMATVIVKLN